MELQVGHPCCAILSSCKKTQWSLRIKSTSTFHLTVLLAPKLLASMQLLSLRDQTQECWLLYLLTSVCFQKELTLGGVGFLLPTARLQPPPPAQLFNPNQNPSSWQTMEACSPLQCFALTGMRRFSAFYRNHSSLCKPCKTVLLLLNCLYSPPCPG